MKTYKIVRHYFEEATKPYHVEGGLTLEEAQHHCNNREASSTTCQLAKNLRRTKQRGGWFDGYTEE